MTPFRAHWLRLRATAHPTEDVERVIQAMQALVAGDVVQTPVESQHGGRLVLLETHVTRSQDIRAALRHLLAGVDVDAASRTDDEGVFYLRFDKQAAYAGRIVVTAGDDAIQLRVKPAVHPATRDAAVAAMQARLDGATD